MERTLKTGAVVYIASDVDKRYPMTVIKEWRPGEYQVFWLSKSGKRFYDVFPVISLTENKEVNNLKRFFY